MKRYFPDEAWYQERNVRRGLNLYSDQEAVFEFYGLNRKQILGGGPYKSSESSEIKLSGGAGWALGLERFMLALNK